MLTVLVFRVLSVLGSRGWGFRVLRVFLVSGVGI